MNFEMMSGLRRAGVSMMWVAGALVAMGLSACSEPSNEGCADDRECARGQVCQGGSCNEVPCFGANECGESRTCSALGTCSAIECLEDADCATSGLGNRCIDRACFDTCGSNADCPDGQICDVNAGECVEPDVNCTSDDGCPTGEVCDTSINRCVPETPNNEVNNENNEVNNENNEVNNVSGGAPCTPCSNSSECGGDGDECTVIGANAETFCTIACNTDADCAAGFECAQAIPNVSPQQCLPIANRCEGCLLPDQACGPDQVCDLDTLSCTTPRSNCQPCSDSTQCVSGGVCYQEGGLSVCGEPCAGPNDCPSGYTCSQRDGGQICVTTNNCGDTGACDPAPMCTEETPVLNEEFCTCVECSVNEDCPTMQVCGTNFRCLSAADACQTGDDCAAPSPFCLGGYCVGCVSDVDCTANPGDICIAGQCQACECPPGQRCNARGECIDASGCERDADCGQGNLGPGRCNPDDGTCYEAGFCGASDGFNSMCPPGLTCTPTLGGLVNVCAGCTPGGGDCRPGETCLPSLDDPNVSVCAGFGN